MASRKEQKEQLRREREQREAQAQAARRRKQMVGYGAGGLAVLVIVVVAAVVLAGGGGGDGKSDSASGVLPDGGSVPEREVQDLAPAAKAAGCKVESFKGTSREHTEDLAEKINYSSQPPTSGSHFATPAEDGAYDKAPDAKELVHTLEHGRVVVWFKKSLAEDNRANLKALFDEDSYQMVLTPDPTRMKYQVAATAWSREPTPNGTGRLLGCTEVNDRTFDAIQAFRDEYRGNGPEAVP
jgi:hypothetical protein